MANETLNMDTLPDNANTELDLSVPHKLTVVASERVTTKNGCVSLQNSYTIDDTKRKLNFDNCIINLANGDPCDYGRAKLKKILNATNAGIKGDFNLQVAAKILIGKSFNAILEKNEKGYYVLPNDLNGITPAEPVTLSATPKQEEKMPDSLDINLFTQEVQDDDSTPKW